jgi:hypothetical protein
VVFYQPSPAAPEVSDISTLPRQADSDTWRFPSRVQENLCLLSCDTHRVHGTKFAVNHLGKAPSADDVKALSWQPVLKRTTYRASLLVRSM